MSFTLYGEATGLFNGSATELIVPLPKRVWQDVQPDFQLLTVPAGLAQTGNLSFAWCYMEI